MSDKTQNACTVVSQESMNAGYTVDLSHQQNGVAAPRIIGPVEMLFEKVDALEKRVASLEASLRRGEQ